MNQATMWWLHHTATGRRQLERMLPLGAIPAPVRRQMCFERGHDYDHRRGQDQTCLRCGERRSHEEDRS